jgi:Astacin (Peptidase family M12A)/FG-GAP-like repeat
MKIFFMAIAFIITVLLSAPVNAQQRTKSYRKIPLRELKDSIFHCTIIGKKVYLDGDIYLGDTTELNWLQNIALAVVIDDNFLAQTRWANGIVPVEIDNRFLFSQRNSIITALNEIMAPTNLTFKLHGTEPDYIFYKNVTVGELGFSGGSSPVGRKGGRQEISISSLSSKTIKHETLHSLGFYHEQSRGDRDDFVRILEQNVDRTAPDKLPNFDKHWFFAKMIGPYNFRSIMHYGATDFGIIINGVRQTTIERIVSNPADRTFGNSTLSTGDINALNEIYPNSPNNRLMIPLLTDIFKDNENWTSGPYLGSRGNFFADVTGDGKADAIVSNRESGITVRRSSGTSFSPNERWTSSDFNGKKGTFFADVTGDGKADVIAININSTLVRRSTGNSFAAAETWSTNFLGAAKGTFFADVTGDGKADAIMVEVTGIKVFRSTGTGFSAGVEWTSNEYFGNVGTFFADVTGDGRADAIVVNDWGVTVRRSTGTSFSPNETWTNNPYLGSRGIFFADVTGDGRADAIVVNEAGVTIRRSSGSGFLPNETGTSNPYLADKGIFFSDIKGSGRCAAIVVNNSNVVARPSQQ